MPMVGLGMWQIERESTPGVVVDAMQAGYRHIDIAADYGNEVETGVGTERLRENVALFDFELSDNEMDAISALNRNQRFNDPGEFCEQKFGSICPIYD